MRKNNSSLNPKKRSSFSMGCRLENYCLFCNTAFLSLFTINLSDICIYDNIHSKLEQQKPAKYIVNFRYISEVFEIIILYDKIHSKLEQKKPKKNMS